MMDPKHADSGDTAGIDGVETLERAAPWIVVGLIVVLVVLSILSAAMGAPWWK